MNDVCLYRIPDDAGGPYGRCRYDDGRWSVEEDPDKICCACETNEGGEAHHNIEELLDLVYFPHDAHPTRLFSYGHVVTGSLSRLGPFD